METYPGIYPEMVKLWGRKGADAWRMMDDSERMESLKRIVRRSYPGDRIPVAFVDHLEFGTIERIVSLQLRVKRDNGEVVAVSRLTGEVIA